jgi:hypothetical protein
LEGTFRIVLGRKLLSLNMGNLCNRGRKSLRKEKPIEKVIEERKKVRLGMKKHRILAEGNPNCSAIDVVVVFPP